MRFLLTLSLLCWLGIAQAGGLRVLVQQSPLAGSQYYALSTVWQEIKPGDALTLVREPGNRHDANAIRVEWRGQKLGYVPRAENRAVCRGDIKSGIVIQSPPFPRGPMPRRDNRIGTDT